MTALATVFSALARMSVTALPAMGTVLLARLLLRRAPAKFRFFLWTAVGFRLVSPAGLPLPTGIFRGSPALAARSLPLAAELLERAPETVLSPGGGAAAAQAAQSGMGAVTMLDAAAALWLAGLAVLLLWSGAADLRVRRQVAAAEPLKPGVYQCGGLETPFVLGLFRPRIYVPRATDPETLRLVLLHERAHIRRRDPLWKLAAFFLLAVYWWDPAVWLCYGCFCRDMEMSCDEAVLRTLGAEGKRAYSLSLLSFAAGRRFPAASPAFGEHDAKPRVKNILRWRERGPASAALAAVLAAALAAACCLDAPDGSWVRVRAARDGAGASFTARIQEPARYWAVYQDVYDHGTLISSAVNVMDGFADDGNGASSRDLDGTLMCVPEYGADGAWNGALSCSLRIGGTRVDWTTETPLTRPTGAGMVSGEERVRLDETGEAELLTYLLSDEADGSVTFPRNGDPALCNGAAVRFRLVTARSEAAFSGESGTHPAAARLYALKNPFVGDVPADDALLTALGVPQLGSYTLELFTSQRPYVLQISFAQEPEDADALDRAMAGRAAALLALIENLDEVRWSYPRTENGEDTRVTVYFDLSAARSAGLDGEVKDYGASPASLETLLRYWGLAQ